MRHTRQRGLCAPDLPATCVHEPVCSPDVRSGGRQVLLLLPSLAPNVRHDSMRSMLGVARPDRVVALIQTTRQRNGRALRRRRLDAPRRNTGPDFSGRGGIFGGSNQLLAGVTLLVTTLWLSKIGKRTIFTGVPAVFMIGTTIAALAYTAVATFSIGFTASGVKAYGSGLAGVIATILTVLGLV